MRGTIGISVVLGLALSALHASGTPSEGFTPTVSVETSPDPTLAAMVQAKQTPMDDRAKKVWNCRCSVKKNHSWETFSPCATTQVGARQAANRMCENKYEEGWNQCTCPLSECTKTGNDC